MSILLFDFSYNLTEKSDKTAGTLSFCGTHRRLRYHTRDCAHISETALIATLPSVRLRKQPGLPVRQESGKRQLFQSALSADLPLSPALQTGQIQHASSPDSSFPLRGKSLFLSTHILGK